ncbi:hypothetical protein [Acinetobacter pittii]|uniref:hypothetical protein n=1 Tax=Acinetobacter pittii TaxID=48296 RepID=UPI00326028B6
MFQNLDDSIFPLIFEISEYMPYGYEFSDEENRDQIIFSSPKVLIKEYFTNPKIEDFQCWYNQVLDKNNIYNDWLLNSTSLSDLKHINQYMNTYTSSEYYEKYGSEKLIEELKNNSHFLPKDQILYRGGSSLELPENWNIGSSINWSVPRSTTLNIETAKIHAYTDCIDRNNVDLANLESTPVLMVLRTLNSSVKGYVFHYEEQSTKHVEKEVLLCPNIKLTKTAEEFYDKVKVIYADISE